MIPQTACSHRSGIRSRYRRFGGLPGNAGFVTGGWDGEIDQWSDLDHLAVKRLRERTAKPTERRALGLGLHQPTTIMGLVSTISDHRLVAVNATGDLFVDVGTRDEHHWSIPVVGSPRSMKRGGVGDPSAVVAMIELT
jgi:hypothetical protein